jgi:hypothetical protein
LRRGKSIGAAAERKARSISAIGGVRIRHVADAIAVAIGHRHPPVPGEQLEIGMVSWQIVKRLVAPEAGGISE